VRLDELAAALTEFVSFAQGLRGDEKSESQSFLDHFFRALGHEGAIEAGAAFEFRVAKKPGSPQLELSCSRDRRSRPQAERRQEICRPALAGSRAHRDEVARCEPRKAL
jgi:hypothetical protein